MALRDWLMHLGNFDAKWNDQINYSVKRMSDGSSMFAFSFRRVLYVGANVLGGVVHNRTEWNEHHKTSLRWIANNVKSNADDVDLIVILGHAAPSADNTDFFEPLTLDIKRWNKMT
eukprot:10295076-Ditylum_brightwellii.AAC.1